MLNVCTKTVRAVSIIQAPVLAACRVTLTLRNKKIASLPPSPSAKPSVWACVSSVHKDSCFRKTTSSAIKTAPSNTVKPVLKTLVSSVSLGSKSLISLTVLRHAKNTLVPSLIADYATKQANASNASATFLSQIQLNANLTAPLKAV